MGLWVGRRGRGLRGGEDGAVVAGGAAEESKESVDGVGWVVYGRG